MTLRLGFVGCGRWGRKLAESFRACGAEVVAYDRKTPALETRRVPSDRSLIDVPVALDGFGRYQTWRDQVADKSIDAIIAVAPPEITTQVALECARQGKAVMATKPVLRFPEIIRAPWYCDYFRLWSNAHADVKKLAWLFRDQPVELVLSGSGPFRDFPGALDYGPHVVAAMLDISRGCTPHADKVTRLPCAAGELFEARFVIPDGPSFYLRFGNGDSGGTRKIGVYVETPTHIGTEPKDEVIQKMCRSFLSDVSEGFVDTRLLSLSREGMRLLQEIRARAESRDAVPVQAPDVCGGMTPGAISCPMARGHAGRCGSGGWMSSGGEIRERAK